ncbi:MAG TPA: methyltransferase domain-containing protein [Stellaceae bacterium]|jgi:SAM-dependent methyltransferase|nr:methyltransferase domain-containing protein [Stellaceae bacterium]
MTDQLPLADRLVALLDHLGIGRTHIASQIPGDMAGLAAAQPERLGGIVCVTPIRLDPAPFAGIADRMLMVAGEYGPTWEATSRALARLPGAQRIMLEGYEAQGWADSAADCPSELVAAMTGFLARHTADAPEISGAGEHAGITYRIEGRGPALLLMPFFLAASQWAPVRPELAKRFTVVTIGGRHVGGMAMLEDRAAAPSYRAMFRGLIDAMAPQSDELILDIGCGAGSLDRQLAQMVPNKIVAVDPNSFLQSEAAALAGSQGLGDRIEFRPGNAEALPFPDATFGCVFSVTVFEECDADKAIAEAVRVTKPGGRIAVAVRATDMSQWWNLDLPEAILSKVTPTPRSVAPAGVADASLYRRMRRAGLKDLVSYPALVTLDRPDGPIWRYREDHVLSLLSADELPVWHAARDKAAADGTLLCAHPLHCCIGTKP